MPSLLRSPFALLVACPLLLVQHACSGGGDRHDTAAAPAATAGPGANPADTGMAAMRHDSMSMSRGAMAAERSAPRDSNQSFLRTMSDHHQGLIALCDSAMGKLGAPARSDAQRLRTEQKREQDHMLAMLRSDYKDSVTPMILPTNRQMIATVTQASTSDADRVFYEQVVAHHREGVQMIDRMLPHLTEMSKDMASSSRMKQQKEIAEFEKKAGEDDQAARAMRSQLSAHFAHSSAQRSIVSSPCAMRRQSSSQARQIAAHARQVSVCWRVPSSMALALVSQMLAQVSMSAMCDCSACCPPIMRQCCTVSRHWA